MSIDLIDMVVHDNRVIFYFLIIVIILPIKNVHKAQEVEIIKKNFLVCVKQNRSEKNRIEMLDVLKEFH